MQSQANTFVTEKRLRLGCVEFSTPVNQLSVSHLQLIPTVLGFLRIFGAVAFHEHMVSLAPCAVLLLNSADYSLCPMRIFSDLYFTKYRILAQLSGNIRLLISDIFRYCTPMPSSCYRCDWGLVLVACYVSHLAGSCFSLFVIRWGNNVCWRKMGFSILFRFKDIDSMLMEKIILCSMVTSACLGRSFLLYFGTSVASACHLFV